MSSHLSHQYAAAALVLLALFGADLREAHADPKSATLVLSTDLHGRVMLFDLSDELVLETDKSSGDAMTLGLAAGTYHVSLQVGRSFRSAQIVLLADQGTTLSSGQFENKTSVLRDEDSKDCELEEDDDGEDIFDLTLFGGVGVADSLISPSETLMVNTSGLEITLFQTSLQFRFKHGFAAELPTLENGTFELRDVSSLGGDLALLRAWRWGWFSLRGGVRTGADYIEAVHSEGNFAPFFGEDPTSRYVAIRAGWVGQAVIRPLSWLGFYAESAGDLVLLGVPEPEHAYSSQIGVQFHIF